VKEQREREREPERAAPAIPARRAAGLTEHLLRLQATAGNAAVARALARTEEEETAEDPFPFPEGVEVDDAETAEDHSALFYAAMTAPREAAAEPVEDLRGFFPSERQKPEPVEDLRGFFPSERQKPEPVENLRGFFPSEKQKPEALEGLEGTKLFNEPKPPKQKAKAPPQPAYNPLGFLGVSSGVAPIPVAKPVPKPAAKPAKAKPAKRAPRPFESDLTEEQQDAVETEAQRMMAAIATRLQRGDSGNRTIDIGLPSEAVADVKNWLRTNYDDVVAPTRGPRNEEVRYHIVTDRSQRTKIDVTGHIWIRGEDKTQGGGRPNVFNYHVEWAQHW
jgi:hypothetical protein